MHGRKKKSRIIIKRKKRKKENSIGYQGLGGLRTFLGGGGRRRQLGNSRQLIDEENAHSSREKSDVRKDNN